MAETLLFQQGVGGHSGMPEAGMVASPTQGLLRFGDLVGPGDRRIAPGTEIKEAFVFPFPFDPGSGLGVHGAFVDGDEASLFADFGPDGLTPDGLEDPLVIDVTTLLQSVADGEAAAIELALLPTLNGCNGVDIDASEQTVIDGQPALLAEMADASRRHRRYPAAGLCASPARRPRRARDAPPSARLIPACPARPVPSRAVGPALALCARGQPSIAGASATSRSVRCYLRVNPGRRSHARNRTGGHKPMTRFTALALVAGLAAAPALAADPWALDKSHATITFEVSHLGFSTTHGVFREMDADIRFDPEAVETTQVDFVVQAASIDTFWEKRDEHLRNADFFNVDEHPEITFTSTKVTPTGNDTATVEGELTMLGVTRPVSFEATLNKLAPSPFNPDKQIAGFTITGEIDRTAFGMNYGAPAISAVIPVRVDLEISPAPAS